MTWWASTRLRIRTYLSGCTPTPRGIQGKCSRRPHRPYLEAWSQAHIFNAAGNRAAVRERRGFASVMADPQHDPGKTRRHKMVFCQLEVEGVPEYMYSLLTRGRSIEKHKGIVALEERERTG